LEKILVKVTKILWPREPQEGNNWKLLLTDRGKCAGKIPWNVQPGEELYLTGEDESRGMDTQFSFASVSMRIPANPLAKLALAAEQTNGMGPKLVDRIKAIHGDDWETSMTLGSVPGLSPRIWDALQETLRNMAQNGAASETIAWLMGVGCTVNLASKAWEIWKEETMGLVNGNCYTLSDVPNYGFCHVDKAIRRNFGIDDNDPRRIRAAVEYAMKQATADGSDCAEWADVVSRAITETGGVTRALIVQHSETLFEAGTLVTVPGTSLVALGTDYRNSELIREWI